MFGALHIHPQSLSKQSIPTNVSVHYVCDVPSGSPQLTGFHLKLLAGCICHSLSPSTSVDTAIRLVDMLSVKVNSDLRYQRGMEVKRRNCHGRITSHHTLPSYPIPLHHPSTSPLSPLVYPCDNLLPVPSAPVLDLTINPSASLSLSLSFLAALPLSSSLHLSCSSTHSLPSLALPVFQMYDSYCNMNILQEPNLIIRQKKSGVRRMGEKRDRAE